MEYTKEFISNVTYDEFINNFIKYPSYKEAQSKGFEAHHLIPISIQKKSGIDRDSSDFNDTCIRVTPFEHIICHYLMAKDFGNEYIKIFVLMISFNKSKISDINKLTLEDLEYYSYLRECGIKKISEALKNRIPYNKGKKVTSEETIKKLSDSHKNHIWVNDGVNEYLVKENVNNLPLGRLPIKESTRESLSISHIGTKINMTEEDKLIKNKKISEALKNRSTNKHWYTNGISNILDYKCPEGYVLGRTLSEDFIKKASEAHKGLKDTEETKLKKSEALKRYLSNHKANNSKDTINIVTHEIFSSGAKGRNSLNFTKSAWLNNKNNINSRYYILQYYSDYIKDINKFSNWTPIL